MKLGNLAARVATALVLVPLVVLAVSWRRPEGVWAIVFIATALSLKEYFSMALDDNVERSIGWVAGAFLATYLYVFPGAPVALLPAAVIAPAIFYLFRFRDLPTVLARLGAMSFGIVYAGLLLPFVALAKRDGGVHGGDWVYVILMIAWFGDTAAYFAGRFLGRRKLYSGISPGKTWAGAVGGLGGALLAGVVANLWLFPELGWIHGIVITAVGGALGQLGDLVESMLKRARGVKDSGRLLPGHGGMLDRIDAVLFIAPWVYLYALFVWA